MKENFRESKIMEIEEIEEAIKDLGHQDEDQHGDECDCISCLARRAPGGLDYDPTSSEDEEEEHENQVIRDKELDK